MTGSGKTFTMANVIQAFGRPTLVLSHNKTLAAQLYGEFKGFFPRNAVEYFVSLLRLLPARSVRPARRDIYIEKDASINEDIDRLRLRATSSLMEREDVIIVSTRVGIYGLGDPVDYREHDGHASPGGSGSRATTSCEPSSTSSTGGTTSRSSAGTFRVRGDTVEIWPAYEEQAVRIELWGDEVERLSKINALTGETITELERAAIYPAKHFITSRPTLERAVTLIQQELGERLEVLRRDGKLLEAQRLESRTHFDIEMMLEVGTCAGIENYSRHLSGAVAGRTARMLFDYFPEDFLVVVDESHVTLPQVRGMFNGDRAAS